MAPGTIFAGRYRIGDTIGEGATGTVYAAVRLSDDAEVALKVLHAHLLADRQVSKRFCREASILHRLHGEHIVRVEDYGEDPSGVPYMALERAPGRPLDTILSQQRLPLPAVVAVMHGIALALQEAHEQDVIHRDLKPSNVLVKMEGDQVQAVHVLDFGMSKVLHGEPGSTNLTEQNMVLGTPEYMAPEQARGDETDERGDVYAAGVILYEMLAGKVPFARRSPLAVLTAHLTEPPPPLAVASPDRPIPPAIEAVCMHAMAKQPSDRYPSAKALYEALQHGLSSPQDTTSVRPPPVRDSLPFRDTEEYGVALADTLSAQPEARSTASTSPVAAPSQPYSMRFWIAVGLSAGLLGVVVGSLMALRC